MGDTFRASLNECHIGGVIHAPHTWRTGLFWSIKYRCDGVSERWYETLQILKAGSAGTLTQDQINAYLSRDDGKKDWE